MVEHSPSDRSDTQGSHLELLSLIEQHPEYSQRRLAQAMGISLGKAHYLLKALFDKGLVKAGNFRRSDSKLSYLYVLTPDGVRHRLQLTQSFLRRKEQEFELLRDEIDRLRAVLGEQASGSRAPDTVN
ncbi:MAG TPA: MarR family EPS-associated transcriptional regulator [Ideonella sp.]|uniref:MarR family EPS-associated transcriptional regulator n=1 Tax=Ideonella sp. TaxID=1929293 RepID=UPI002BAD1FB6|nr:MarR family EPS-associated transcriptional regulator [Ideonella sp.]HSI48413.1 MarR family EPS-associated transcriptional regulator [Ideonella sp.]